MFEKDETQAIKMKELQTQKGQLNSETNYKDEENHERCYVLGYN